MDLYDPQTLGVMVFGGFMVISAIGIFLVSTFSMKETSYEEALAKQRKEQEKKQAKADKKKKDKIIDKKGKSKKKDEKANGKIPEYEHAQFFNDQKKSESESEVEAEELPVWEVPVVPAVVPTQERSAPSPKDKKKKQEKKVLKVEPSPSPIVAVTKPAASQPPVAKPAASQPPVAKPAASQPPVAKPAASQPPVAKPAASQPPVAKPAASQPPVAKPAASQPNVTKPTASKPVASKPASAQASVAKPASSQASVAKPASSQASVAKPASSQASAAKPVVSKAAVSKPAVTKSTPGLEVTAKEVPVVADTPVGSQNVPVTNSLPPRKAETILNHDDSKPEAPKKKNAAKKKSEQVNESDGAIYLPYKTLVSTISSMVFSEGEAQKLIEILTEKNGIIQDTWHTATQKGDPVTALKRQLEDKEKLLSAEQEDATAAKNKLRELNKELVIEKTKALSVESKFKEQLLSREQEITALQARMQASYQDHVNEAQQLQGKIRTLQEELENGPNAQLARLQQENSILRDALNQATSQTESKQNAELAKLRQECNKLTKELTEKAESLQQEEQKRKSLDVKVSTYEKQVSQLQSLQQESEATLQKRLDEVSEELRMSQTSYKNLLTDTEKAKEEQKNLADFQTKLLSYEAEAKQKSEELDRQCKKVQEVTDENLQLTERIKSIEALLEAGQNKDTDIEKQLLETKDADLAQLHSRLQEKDSQISSLEKEAIELKDTIEQHKNKNNDLREKNWQAMEALNLAEKTCEEKLNAEKKSKEEMSQQLSAVQTQTKETLLSVFPQVTVESQSYSDWLQEFKEKTSQALSQQPEKSDSSELLLKLKESEEAQSTLQEECEKYRTTLAETEGMLKDLQKSVEQEEEVWKVKLTASEEELKKSQSQVKTLEDVLEKLKLDLQSAEQLKQCLAITEAQLERQMNTASTERQNYSKEVENLQQLLSETQNDLISTTTEARKQSQELSLLRQQLSEMQNHVHDRESVGSQDHQSDLEPFEIVPSQTNLEEQSTEQNILEALEEQKSVCSLQEELEKLKTSEEAAHGAEEAQQLQGEENDSNSGTSV